MTELTTDVTRRLDLLTDPATKAWWERYLKAAVPFLGVKMAGIRRVASAVASAHLEGAPTDTRVDAALACFELPHCEEKLVGVLLLAEHLLDHLTIEHVPRLGSPFASGHVSDWNTCDWYAVKVLGPFVLAGPDGRARAEAIAAWRVDGGLWQRRAAAVAFVNLIPQGDAQVRGLIDLVLTVCEANVADPTRWSQTSVGWVLRELSAVAPDRVRAFVSAHPEMLAEARRSAVARL